MRRYQLFELEDLSWWPRPLRRAMLEYLSYISVRYHLVEHMVELLAPAIRRTDSRTVVDLCAGAGGPWPELSRRLADEATVEQVMLCDLFPDADYYLHDTNKDLLTYLPQSVDAGKVPDKLHGFRTIWNAFHHFTPKQGVEVLRDAIKHQAGIAVFESVERTPRCVIEMALAVPLLVLLDTPRVKPRRLLRFIFTYIIPLLPIAIAYDGVISALRSYSITELMELAEQADEEGRYEWECGYERKNNLTAITYLIGYPRS